VRRSGGSTGPVGTAQDPATVITMDDDNFFDEPIRAPEGIQAITWTVEDPIAAKLMASIDNLARVVREQLEWQRSTSNGLTARSGYGPTPNGTATATPSIGFGSVTEAAKFARSRLTPKKTR
jgi:hypothetical protein